MIEEESKIWSLDVQQACNIQELAGMLRRASQNSVPANLFLADTGSTSCVKMTFHESDSLAAVWKTFLVLILVIHHNES